MPERRAVTSEPIHRVVTPQQSYVIHPVGGLVATDGVVYSAVATVGTTAVEVFSSLIDPGVDMALREIEVGLTQRFNNLDAASVASLSYYWRVRQNNQATLGAWLGIMATQSRGVPTSGVSGDPAEDTFSGYIPVGSLPEAPFDISLMAVALVASSFVVDAKNSSYIKLVGAVIPGT